MLRFFRDTRDGESIIYDAAKSILSSRRGDAVVHRTSTCFTADDRLSLTNWRELPPAEFLAETRGKAIADKALELLAAERGVRCWSRGYNWWVCGAGKRLCLPGMSIYDIEHPDDDPNHGCAKSDLATILASEPGKKHREQIEAFILGLPVVGDEWFVIDDSKCRSPKDRVYEAIHAYERSPGPLESCTLPALLDRYSHDPGIVARIRELTGETVANDEPKERTLLDVVRDATDAHICSDWIEYLNQTPASEWQEFFNLHVINDEDATDWIERHLRVSAVDFVRHEDHRFAIARRLGLVADEPEAESVRPRVRCFEMGDVYWIAIDYGNGFVGYGCGGNDRTVGLQCEWPTTVFDNITEVTIEHVRQKYAGQEGIAKLDELLRETGEYVDPEAERGDYVMYFVDGGSGGDEDETFLDVTEAEAIARVRKEVASFAEDGEIVTLALRPLGPAILTLRSVEKTTWEVEEVPCPQ